jgi:hypothetical protein
MVDHLTFTREVQGVYERVLNEETGALEKAEEDSLIFEGYCAVTIIRRDDATLTMGEMPKDINGYKILMPISTTSSKVISGNPSLVSPGDHLTVVSAKYNTGLNGRKMIIGTSDDGTHTLYRRVMALDEVDYLNNPQF